MVIKADHILFVLSLFVLMMIVANIGLTASDPRRVVRYDCALFYGASGPAAEDECRVNMLKMHLLPTGPR